MTAISTLIDDNIAVLAQARELLAGLDPETYSSTAALPVASGAGSHIRHCLDFYDRLLVGLETGRIDYNVRSRDQRTAKDPAFACERISESIDRLSDLPGVGGTLSLVVRAEGSADANEPGAWGRSSLARELQALLSHSIHHFALIAMILRLQGVAVPDEFGVAPSTLAYWRNAS